MVVILVNAVLLFAVLGELPDKSIVQLFLPVLLNLIIRLSTSVDVKEQLYKNMLQPAFNP